MPDNKRVPTEGVHTLDVDGVRYIRADIAARNEDVLAKMAFAEIDDLKTKIFSLCEITETFVNSDRSNAIDVICGPSKEDVEGLIKEARMQATRSTLRRYLHASAT